MMRQFLPKSLITKKLFLFVLYTFITGWSVLTWVQYNKLPSTSGLNSGTNTNDRALKESASSRPVAAKLFNASSTTQPTIVSVPPLNGSAVRDNNSLRIEIPISKEELKTKRLVIYNRVPKCGSTTMYVLMRNMSFNLNYNYTNNNTFRPSLKPSQQVSDTSNNAFRSVLTSPTGLRYVRPSIKIHSRFNKSIPVYINIVRDPIERFASHYYCCYAPKTRGKPGITLDECVKKTTGICGKATSTHWTLMLHYFCGQDPQCATSSRNALERAKQNVIKHYTAVGYLENLSQFFTLLEHFLPQFFKGLPDIFKENNPIKNASNDPRKNSTLSSSAREILKQRLGLEYELYNFIKERFHSLYNSYIP